MDQSRYVTIMILKHAQTLAERNRRLMRLFRSRGCPAKDDEYGNRLYELYQEDTDEGYVWFTDSDDECGYSAYSSNNSIVNNE